MNNLPFAFSLHPPFYPSDSYKLRATIVFVPEGVGNKNRNIMAFVNAELPCWLGMANDDNIFNAIYLSSEINQNEINQKKDSKEEKENVIYTTPVKLTISFTGLSFQHPDYPRVFLPRITVPTLSCYVWNIIESVHRLLQGGIGEFPIFRNAPFAPRIEKIKLGRVGKYAFIIHPAIPKFSLTEGEGVGRIRVEIKRGPRSSSFLLHIYGQDLPFYDGEIEGAVLMMMDKNGKEPKYSYPLKPAQVFLILKELLNNPLGLERWFYRRICEVYGVKGREDIFWGGFLEPGDFSTLHPLKIALGRCPRKPLH